jgi:hypothetical protein
VISRSHPVKMCDSNNKVFTKQRDPMTTDPHSGKAGFANAAQNSLYYYYYCCCCCCCCCY